MSKDSSDIEKELLSRVAKGDEAAFGILVREHSGFLYNYLFKLCKQQQLVEEVVQEVFTQLWVTRESVSQIRHFRPYLLTVSRNHAIALLKKALREKTMIADYWEYQNTGDEDKLLQEYKFSLIEEAVAQLPPQQQKVWELSRRKGKKYMDIAEELQISRETVKKHLQYANSSISDYIKEKLLLTLALFVLLHK